MSAETIQAVAEAVIAEKDERLRTAAAKALELEIALLERLRADDIAALDELEGRVS